MSLGCQNSDRAFKSEKIKIESDTIDYECTDFYSDGEVMSRYFLKENKIHGYNANYYHNGKIDFEGNWETGKKKGLFKYFDSLGNLEKIIEFVPFRDSLNSRPNQVIKINTAGDTIVDKSLYYEYYSVSDTIKSGVPYEFKIVLRGHIYDNAFIRFCDFDDKFNLAYDEEKCEVVNTVNFGIQLKYTRTKIGVNYLRGVIVNYNRDPTTNEAYVGKYVEVYFSHKFYVVP
ncbi:MAG: hypothetical protein WC756_10880 [Taibaiella sp.]